MFRRPQVRELYRDATEAPEKLKAREAIAALYTDFEPWTNLLAFTPAVRTPGGRLLEADPRDPVLQRTMLVGVARFEGQDVALIAQQTPPREEERGDYNYGMTPADGYILALSMMHYAALHQLPLHTFIDTVGGDPFEAAAAKLQSWLISECITTLLTLEVPTVSVILGHGGSGGALALQPADWRLMLERAVFSVISAQGCAAILFRAVTEETVAAALDVLQPTADAMLRYGIVDAVVAEPPLSAPDYRARTLDNLRQALRQAMQALAAMSCDERVAARLAKVARCGRVSERKPWELNLRVVQLTRRLFRKTVSQTRDPHVAAIRWHLHGDPNTLPLRCKDERDPADPSLILRPGCRKYLDEEAFQRCYFSCPYCGRPDSIDAYHYIDLLFDRQSFHELYPNLTVEDIEGWRHFYDYTASRRQAEARAHAKEALVIGYATLRGLPVACAISHFPYLGGSLGAASGEKFCAIADYALDHRLPLLIVTATGGARMQEGTVALYQMAKTCAAMVRLRRAGLLTLAVLGHPTTGGTFASYATQAEFLVAEQGATLAFAGHRVVKLTSGGRVLPPAATTAAFFAEHGLLHAVVPRPQLPALLYGVLRSWYARQKAPA
ncbi:MAG: hypothetical protein KatS3mg131_2562 [Candidatus Tectimicrobiota bacterium]|nr:MAG: hypothetical protein KatS3mg131_2562 [Candidatus Tectomicrobia bacterium]